jgi:histidyl-tRNA synthetase
LARELRAAGLKIDLYPEADKLGKQFKYASSVGVPFVAVIGEDEQAKGLVAVKEMGSGEQQAVRREEAVDLIKRFLTQSRKGAKEDAM